MRRTPGNRIDSQDLSTSERNRRSYIAQHTLSERE
jgi:hypothetical protein